MLGGITGVTPLMQGIVRSNPKVATSSPELVTPSPEVVTLDIEPHTHPVEIGIAGPDVTIDRGDSDSTKSSFMIRLTDVVIKHVVGGAKDVIIKACELQCQRLYDLKRDLTVLNGKEKTNKLCSLLAEYVRCNTDGTSTEEQRKEAKTAYEVFAAACEFPPDVLVFNALKNSVLIRQPLFMEQVYFSVPVPEIPGTTVKIGVQLHIVTPSITACSILRDGVQTNPDWHLQAFLHLEAGYTPFSYSFGSGFSFAAWLGCIQHLGIDVSFSKNSDGSYNMHPDKDGISFVIEEVFRADVNSGHQGDVRIQATFGSDVVIQSYYKFNRVNDVVKRLTIQAGSALVPASMIVATGGGCSAAAFSGVLACMLSSRALNIIPSLESDRRVIITEGATFGLDAWYNSSNGFGCGSMNRLNGGIATNVPRETVVNRQSGENELRRRDVNDITIVNSGGNDLLEESTPL